MSYVQNNSGSFLKDKLPSLMFFIVLILVGFAVYIQYQMNQLRNRDLVFKYNITQNTELENVNNEDGKKKLTLLQQTADKTSSEIGAAQKIQDDKHLKDITKKKRKKHF